MKFRKLTLKVVVSSLAFSVLSGHAEAADAKKGEQVWKKCRACHEIGQSNVKKIGPYLGDIFGRPAGNIENFFYSKAMIDAGNDGLVWTEENIDEFLKRPKSFIKKTKMNFAGLKKDSDRANLIAFLQSLSDEEGAEALANENNNKDPDLPAEVLALEGDRDYGEYLSGTCVGCHQIDGADEGIPSITGWPSEAFMTAIFSYQLKYRENPVMQQIAGSLNNEEIAALAAYFEELKAAE